jgi:hypothetical protein
MKNEKKTTRVLVLFSYCKTVVKRTCVLRRDLRDNRRHTLLPYYLVCVICTAVIASFT